MASGQGTDPASLLVFDYYKIYEILHDQLEWLNVWYVFPCLDW